jgi:hypothetical protein
MLRDRNRSKSPDVGASSSSQALAGHSLAALTRSVRSQSRSRSPSPAGGVTSGAALGVADDFAIALQVQEVMVDAEMSKQEAQDRADVELCGNRCFWCLEFSAVHLPSKCPKREMADMSDFDQRKPRPSSSTRQKRKGVVRSQTTRTPQGQKAHRAAYQLEHKHRTSALRTAAIARSQAFVAQMSTPIVGYGLFGQFTLAQSLALEFALSLPLQFSDNERMLAEASASAHPTLTLTLTLTRTLNPDPNPDRCRRRRIRRSTPLPCNASRASSRPMAPSSRCRRCALRMRLRRPTMCCSTCKRCWRKTTRGRCLLGLRGRSVRGTHTPRRLRRCRLTRR